MTMQIETHEDKSVTLEGFIRVLASMRYEDIVSIADALENIRSGGEDGCENKITPADVARLFLDPDALVPDSGDAS